MWSEPFVQARANFVKGVESLYLQEDMLAEIRTKVIDVNDSAHQEAVLYCLERYVEAELDYDGPGERGLGRISTETPRYGAYFRRSLSRLHEGELSELRQLITDQVVAGYLAHTVLAEDPLLRPTTPGPEDLFRAWVPAIYSSALINSFPKDTWGAMDVLVAPALSRHKEELRQRGIRRRSLFQRDRTIQILVYYSIAGFALRAFETRRLAT